MAGEFLQIDGVTIPVEYGDTSEDNPQFGDYAEAVDGTALTRSIATKRSIQVVTRWMDDSDATTVLAALVGTPPVTASGRLIGAASMEAIVRDLGRGASTDGEGNTIRRFTFTLREA